MLGWMAETTLAASLLAILAVLVIRFGRLGPSARHALWLVVLVKLATPPVVRLPLPLPVPGERPGERARASTAVGDIKGSEPGEVLANEPQGRGVTRDESYRQDLIPEEFVVTFSRDATGSESPENATGEAVAAGEASPFAGNDDGRRIEETPVATEPVDHPALPTAPDWSLDRETLAGGLLGLWAFGALVTAARQVGRVVRFGRTITRDRQEAPAWLRSELDAIAGRLGVRAPGLLALPGTGTPWLWCAGRTRLIVPTELLARLDREHWRGVLAHELAHLRRGDPWVSRLALVLGWVWWWNPLYRFVRSRLEAEAELACDAWVVWALPGGRRRYAEALVEVCAFVSEFRAPAPALGIGGEGRSLERRLTMILKNRGDGRPPRSALLTAGLLGLIALPAWSPAQDDPKPREGDGDRARLEVRVRREREQDRDRPRDGDRGERRPEREERGDRPEAEQPERDIQRDVERQMRGVQEEIQARMREFQEQFQHQMRAEQERLQAELKEAAEQLRKAQQGLREAQEALENAGGDAKADAERHLDEARKRLGEAQDSLHSRVGEFHKQMEERMRALHERMGRLHEEMQKKREVIILHREEGPELLGRVRVFVNPRGARPEADAPEAPRPPEPPRPPHPPRRPAVGLAPEPPRPPDAPREGTGVPPRRYDIELNLPRVARIGRVPGPGPGPEAIEQLDRRMDRLESKFDQILEELRGLRRDREEKPKGDRPR